MPEFNTSWQPPSSESDQGLIAGADSNNADNKRPPATYPAPTPLEALQYGWSIIPCGRDKRALVPWKRYQTTRPTVDEINRWEKTLQPASWAIITGPVSGRISTDYDGPAGVQTMHRLGVHPQRKTPGGYHTDFQQPDWLVPTLNGKSKRELGKLYPGLDVRGSGNGYVIFRGVTAKGYYEWLVDPTTPVEPFETLPEDLRLFLRKAAKDQRVPFDRLLAEARSMLPDGRDNAGFWLSCQLRDAGYSEAEALAVDWPSYCGPVNTKGQHEPYGNADWQRTVRSAYSRSAREPRAKPGDLWTDAGRASAAEPSDEPHAGTTGRIPPQPKYHPNTGKLIGPIPTVGDTLLANHFFAHNEGEKLHLYDKGVYRDKGSLLVRVRSKQLMQQWTSGDQWTKAFAENVEEWVLLESSQLWEAPPLDRINLLNGIYNLKTGELEPHSHTFLSPVQLPIHYDPKARCPAWNDFLAAAAPADVYEQEVVFQLAGLLIIPYMSAQRAVLLQGERGTGKSRLLTGLRAFLGGRNVSTKSLHQLEENRFASAYLYGKLANIFADLPARHLETTSTFKQITGEDYIDAEYKHGLQFHFKPFCRLLFSANLPPQSKDTSGAFLDRWYVFPFDHRFEGTSDQIAAEVLDQRLANPAELSGVLNKALEYLPKVLDQHGITITDSMLEAHYQFCAVTDPFRVWLGQFIIDDAEAICPCDDAYRSYQEFRKRRKEPPITMTAFGREFKRLKPKTDSKQRTVGVRLRWCYIGVRLKESPTSEGRDG